MVGEQEKENVFAMMYRTPCTTSWVELGLSGVSSKSTWDVLSRISLLIVQA